MNIKPHSFVNANKAMGSFTFGREGVNRQVHELGVRQEEGALQASYLGWHIFSVNYQMQHY